MPLLSFVHRLPPLDSTALRLDRYRRARIDDVLATRRGAVDAIAAACSALADAPDDVLAQRVDRLVSEVLDEFRRVPTGAPRAERSLGRLDAWLRSEAPELLDREALLPPPVKDFSMRLLHRVNTVVGSYDVWTAVLVEALGAVRKAHVYDLAAGTGGYARHLARHPPEGIELRITSSDLSPSYVAAGEAQARAEGCARLRWEVRDALDLRALRERGDVDLFLCTQAVHHLTPGQVTRMVRQAIDAAPGGLLVIDLMRSPLSALATPLFVALAAPWPVLVYDGFQSVRRAYTPAELQLLARLAGARAVSVRAWGPAWCVLRAKLQP
jgi:SAM-dependent methyltransferase